MKVDVFKKIKGIYKGKRILLDPGEQEVTPNVAEFLEVTKLGRCLEKAKVIEEVVEVEEEAIEIAAEEEVYKEDEEEVYKEDEEEIEEEVEEEVDLEDLSKAQLQEYAEENEIEGVDKATQTKPQMIETIKGGAVLE